MAAAILGGAIHHEEKVAAGAEPRAQPLQYKQTLQGPLAAIGDGFFWTALRPFFGAVAALGALLLGWPAIVATLVVYNAIHLVLRVRLFRAGYEKGDAIVGEIARLGAAGRGGPAARVRRGASAAPRRRSSWRAARPCPAAPPACSPRVAAALGYAALARGARLLPTAYAAALFGVAAAVAVGRLHGSS